MRILALVPARGGSKRVPNKNIRELGGKPLINWSIEAAQGIPEILDILVSTDSLVIADVARAAGALVPWLRPAELSTDTATSIVVCMHALDWYEKENGQVDGLLLLQPTSPFRKTQTIQAAIQLFKKYAKRPVVAFSPAESHPMWCYRVAGDAIYPFVHGVDQPTRSQDLPPAYVVNGEVYLATPGYLRANSSFLGSETVPLVIEDKLLVIEDKREALDIDSDWDWLLAENMLNYGGPRSSDNSLP